MQRKTGPKVDSVVEMTISLQVLGDVTDPFPTAETPAWDRARLAEWILPPNSENLQRQKLTVTGAQVIVPRHPVPLLILTHI